MLERGWVATGAPELRRSAWRSCSPWPRAVVYGAADFLGGLASRKTSVFGVVALSQMVGLVALLALLPWLGGPVEAADLWWGAAAGLAGAAGLVVFFRTLARGVMSVIAPVTAVTAAAVPVLVGLLAGDRIGVWSAVGIGLALAAVVLVSAEGGLERAEPGPPGQPAARAPGRLDVRHLLRAARPHGRRLRPHPAGHRAAGLGRAGRHDRAAHPPAADGSRGRRCRWSPRPASAT